MKTWISRHGLLVGFVLGAMAALAAFTLRPGPALPAKPAQEDAHKAAEGKQPSTPNSIRMEVEAQKNLGLRVESAQMRAVVQTIRTTGTVGPNETRVAHVRPLTRGRIIKVNAQLGDQVRAGDVLATYDNIELGEALGQYGVGLAELKRAQSAVGVASRSVERAQSLVDLGAVAKAEVERRSAEQASAQAAIDTQRAELARIEEKLHRFGMTEQEVGELSRAGAVQSHRELSQSTLRAPLSGIVTNRNVVEGETVETDREMFTVADLSVVWLQANLSEKDIREVRKGSVAAVTVDAYPGEIFTAKITYVSDVLDPKTRTVKARAELPNPGGRLKLDMFVAIDIATPAQRQAMMIPASALQQINDQPVVFVRINETDFQRRLVTLGMREGDWVEAVGIKAGESVVTKGSFELKSMSLRSLIGEGE